MSLSYTIFLSSRPDWPPFPIHKLFFSWPFLSGLPIHYKASNYIWSFYFAIFALHSFFFFFKVPVFFLILFYFLFHFISLFFTLALPLSVPSLLSLFPNAPVLMSPLFGSFYTSISSPSWPTTIISHFWLLVFPGFYRKKIVNKPLHVSFTHGPNLFNWPLAS